VSRRLSLPEVLAVTVLGTGFSPIAPATVASAATCIILWFIPAALRWPWALLLVPVTLLGIWLSTRAIEGFEVLTDTRFQKLRRPNPHKEDPDQVVIDEFVGQWIALLAAAHNILGFAAAFIAFRVLDIVKPFGIGATQKLKGGWGIMIDDVLAGIGSAILLLVASWLTTLLLP
jgi:phosphatidylglycerophosphatase A